MIVHLVDGIYELFRHFYALRRFNKGVDRPYGAVVGVLQRFPLQFLRVSEVNRASAAAIIALNRGSSRMAPRSGSILA
jgi:hypothetical protein